MEEINSSKIVIQKSFSGSKGYIFIRKIFPDSKLVNTTLKYNKFKDDTLLFYIRDEQLYTLENNIIINSNDLIVAFTIAKNNQKIKEWLYEL